MYGGLFGDLPSAKKSKADDKSNGTASGKDQGKDGGASEQTGTGGGDGTSSKSKKRPASTLVGKLGTAGTSMAFVPAALRNRKRVVHQSATPSPAPPPAAKAPISAVEASSVSLIHSTTDTVNKSHSLSSPVHDARKGADDDDARQDDTESEVLRLLHASVVDVYNPLEPNDLLAYWDRKAMERERINLERQAKETLERQEHLRQQLEQERQSVARGVHESSSSAALSMGRGRGRGRGVSNLPAWLEQKQKQEEDLGLVGGGCSNGGGNSNVGATEPSDDMDRKRALSTVVLSNLTAPGDIDDELAIEVKEECQDQCGAVTNVLVKDANPPHQPMVQVHVQFENQADAAKAIQIFHGRKFGQRRITAELLSRH